MSDTHPSPNELVDTTKRDERRAFVLLAVFLAPALAVAIVGGWGFFIWMLQIINGPPTG
ncbi:MAG: periplasmic nitrate reductase, NapE protein [Paracoccaceae bacterium]